MPKHKFQNTNPPAGSQANSKLKMYMPETKVQIGLSGLLDFFWKYRNTEIPKYRNTEIPKYRNTEIPSS